MWRYIVAHWQGEQSLPRSVLLNGLLVYLLIVLFAGLAETFSVRIVDTFAWLFLGSMLVWLVWAIVGIIRCGGKVLAESGASKLRKLAAALAILGAAAFAIVAAADVYGLFIYRRVPTSGIKAATRAIGEKPAMDFGASGPKMLAISFLQPGRDMPVPFVRTVRS